MYVNCSHTHCGTHFVHRIMPLVYGRMMPEVCGTCQHKVLPANVVPTLTSAAETPVKQQLLAFSYIGVKLQYNQHQHTVCQN